MPDTPKPEESGAVEGKTFTQPYRIREEVRTRGGTVIQQTAYSLTEADWVRLEHAKPKAFKYATAFVILGVGAAIPLVAKVLPPLAFPHIQETPTALWEWLVPISFFIMALAAGAVGLARGDESRRVKRSIDDFFHWSRTAHRR